MAHNPTPPGWVVGHSFDETVLNAPPSTRRIARIYSRPFDLSSPSAAHWRGAPEYPAAWAQHKSPATLGPPNFRAMKTSEESAVRIQV